MAASPKTAGRRGRGGEGAGRADRLRGDIDELRRLLRDDLLSVVDGAYLALDASICSDAGPPRPRPGESGYARRATG